MTNNKVKICFVELEDERIRKAVRELASTTEIEVVGVGKTSEEELEELTRYYSSENPVVKGLELLREGVVDGLIGGAVLSSKELIKNALGIIGTEEGFASSYQVMKKEGRKFYFADCGFNINPTAEQLALIAEQTAKNAQRLGDEPRVAFLSYSPNGSAGGPSAEKVREATKIFQERNPDILSEGEVQVDAALRPEVARRKNPQTKLAGRANILIFPNLDAGNIGYKLLKEIAGFEGIGPFLQGFKKPIHDLSRGCSVQEIVESAKHMVKEIQGED